MIHEGAAITLFFYEKRADEPAGRVDRIEPGRNGRSKEFIQYRYEDGRYVRGLNGGALPLYHLPDVRRAIERVDAVFIPEGEKKSDRLLTALKDAKIAAAVTTIAGGANATLQPEHVIAFRGVRRINVLADSDPPGRGCATSRAAKLATAYPDADVRVVDFYPDRDDGSDVEDWLDDGHDVTEMRTLVDAAPRVEPAVTSGAPKTATPAVQVVMRRLCDIEAQPVRALWTDRVFYGEPFILAGPPGVGKSFISGALAAAVTRGQPPPGGGDVSEPGDVIVLALEDDAGRVLRPRYEAMGADLQRVHIIDGVRASEEARLVPFSLAHIEALGRCLDRLPNTKLITIDPVASMLNGVDAFRSNEVRERLDPFLDETAARGIAVCLVMHTNKSTTLAGAGRVEGSIGGFVGRARSVLAVGINADTGKHGVGLLKSNLGRIDVPVIAYEIDDTGRFRWLGEDGTTTAAELFESASPEHDVSIGDEVRDAILELLRSGEQSASNMSKALRSQGYSDRTVQRQRSRLRKLDRIEKCGGGTAGEVRWRLNETATDRQETHSSPYIYILAKSAVPWRRVHLAAP